MESHWVRSVVPGGTMDAWGHPRRLFYFLDPCTIAWRSSLAHAHSIPPLVCSNDASNTLCLLSSTSAHWLRESKKVGAPSRARRGRRRGTSNRLSYHTVTLRVSRAPSWLLCPFSPHTSGLDPIQNSSQSRRVWQWFGSDCFNQYRPRSFQVWCPDGLSLGCGSGQLPTTFGKRVTVPAIHSSHCLYQSETNWLSFWNHRALNRRRWWHGRHPRKHQGPTWYWDGVGGAWRGALLSLASLLTNYDFDCIWIFSKQLLTIYLNRRPAWCMPDFLHKLRCSF